MKIKFILLSALVLTVQITLAETTKPNQKPTDRSMETEMLTQLGARNDYRLTYPREQFPTKMVFREPYSFPGNLGGNYEKCRIKILSDANKYIRCLDENQFSKGRWVNVTVVDRRRVLSGAVISKGVPTKQQGDRGCPPVQAAVK